MSLLELIVLCASIYISFAGSPSYILISSIIDETSLQSISSSGPVLVEIVDSRPPCITCYVLFTTNANTTRNCNPNHKFIWELWYNISGVQRGGYCIDFESLNLEKVNPQITSVIATSVSTVSTGGGGSGGFGGGGFGGGGSTTIYQWSKGQEMTVKTGTFPDCVPCYDFLHINPKLSPFECNPGNALKVKVTYEVLTGIEETGYCAGQITMSDKELRKIQKLFWTEKIAEPKCVECYDVIAFGKNASKEFCDNGVNRVWHVQYYKQNWKLAMDGYCVNNRMQSAYYWDMTDDKLFAHIYRLDLSEYYYWMKSKTEVEKTTCKPCAKIIYERKNIIDECKSNGHPLWQVWFNTTYGESFGGYCIDFLKIDLNIINYNYITYILAKNESSTYEWLRSESVLKQVTEVYPPCVNCSDLANEETYLSSFYCDPGNQTKVKVDLTTTSNDRVRGYCAGFFYNFTVGKSQYKPAHIEMYDIFKTYSWNERCVDCYDLFVLGSNASRYDCDGGNETVWYAYYIKQQYYTTYYPEFLVRGYCINFNSSSFDDWILPEDMYYVQAGSEYRQNCISCYDALANGLSLSHKRCLNGGKQLWHVSYTFENSNNRIDGHCIGLYPDSLNSWNILEQIQNVDAENGTETYSWHRPTPSPEECISCYDALVYGAHLSSESCYGGSEQRWYIQFYSSYYYYNNGYGYCNGLYPNSLQTWSIYYNIDFIQAHNGVEYYYYSKSELSSYSSSPLHCVTCYEILLYRSSLNPDCDPQGQTLWDIWFNSTDAFTDGGFCVDFLETDFSGIGDSITYIRASNGSSTVEWLKSDPEIKEINATFPLCVSCYDVAYSNITFSSFDCESGNERKVRAKYTNSLGEENIGYCVGLGSFSFSLANITGVTLYDRYSTSYMPDKHYET